MNVATGGKGTRVLLNAAVYTVLFLAGAVQGLIGSFEYSRLAPFGAIGFCVLLLATCLLGAWALRSISGAVWPAIGWIATSFILSMPDASGSVIITATTAGTWYLYGGTVASLAGIALSFFAAGSRRAGSRDTGSPGAGSPGAGTRGAGTRPR